MDIEQGSVGLLQEPLAQELLASRIPARLAYVGRDQGPRVVPIWFHWNGSEVVMVSPANAPKVKALQANSRISVSIDDASEWPYRVLLVRGAAEVSFVDGVASEYEQSAVRYFGPEQGKQWCDQLRGVPGLMMCRIALKPEWVGLLDFQSRFPQAIAPLFS